MNGSEAFRLGIDMNDEQLRTAMTSPEALVRWAEASGRAFMLINTRHMIEAIPFPDGVTLFQQLITAYRDHRRVMPSAWVENIVVRGAPVTAPVMLGEQLSLDELLQVQEQVARMIEQARNELAAKGAYRG